jgi:D-lactate dehydrogenase
VDRVVIFDSHEHDKQFFNDHLKSDRLALDCVAETIDQADKSLLSEATIAAVHVTSRLDQATIAAMPKLRMILCRSTGYDNVDLAAAKSSGIVVTNVPSYGETTVAEYAAMLMLALSRKLNQSVKAAASGDIDPSSLIGRDLSGKTLGVVGTGRIGRHLIGIAKGLNMSIVAHDIKPDHELAERLNIKYLPLNDLLKESDIVSLHMPLTPENEHMINEEAINLMKPTAILINTARGPLIDTRALADALASGRIAAAGLDVVEGEAMLELEQELHLLQSNVTKLDMSRAVYLKMLSRMDNVLITAHNAYNSEEALQRIREGSLENIQAFLSGSPVNVVTA